MELSSSIMNQVNTILGVSGQSHFIDIRNMPAATGCSVWSIQGSIKPGQIDSLLAAVRNGLANENAMAYKSVDTWYGVYKTEARRIVVCPSTDQFDILRFEQGPPPYSDCEYYIEELKKYDEEYGIDIVGAAWSVVEFSLKRIPTGRDAKALSDRILAFAPDVVNGGGEVVKLIDFKRSGGRIALWWD